MTKIPFAKLADRKQLELDSTQDETEPADQYPRQPVMILVNQAQQKLAVLNMR